MAEKQYINLMNRSSLRQLHPHIVSRVADGAYPHVLGEQVSEDPPHLQSTGQKTDQSTCNHLNPHVTKEITSQTVQRNCTK